MPNARTLEAMSPGLLKVVERAQREPEGRFNSLAHLIDVPALKRAYRRQRTDAAVGVDGVSKEQYGGNLEANLEDLHIRLKDKRYRHQAIRRDSGRRRSFRFRYRGIINRAVGRKW
jgi:RNA-directed DNA polymerase